MNEETEARLLTLAEYHRKATDQFRQMAHNPHTPIGRKPHYLRRAEQHDEWYRAVTRILPSAKIITAK